MNLSNPTTNKAEILYTLITNGSVSIKDFPYLSGFRTRISELVNDLNVYCELYCSKSLTSLPFQL